MVPGVSDEQQYDLYDGLPPHQKHSVTSREAAELIEPSTGTKRAQVLRYIHESGGATDQEIQDALRMDPSTQRPRRRELELQGSVVDSGNKRLTRSKRRAVVWIDTE